MRSDSLIVVTTGRGMVEIPLTSYVVDGQTKWTVMSERKEGNNGDKSQRTELLPSSDFLSYPQKKLLCFDYYT